MYYGRDGQARCRIQENISLKLAPEQAGKELENVRVFIDPAQIDIADACYSDASIPNTVKGRVVQLMEENGHIRAVVDAGILITLMLERSRYQHTRPFVGDVLLLIIPPESIRTL
jgi:ABC-type molybdate transport system ATPase subunit